MDNKKICASLYAVFAISSVLQTIGPTLIIGAFIVCLAAIAAHALRRRARGTLFESHYTWMIRTFWIGTGVWMPLLTLFSATFLLSRINLGSVMDSVGRGEITDSTDMGQMLMALQGREAVYAVLACAIPFLGWWLWRCWRGYAALKQDRAVPDLNRWI